MCRWKWLLAMILMAGCQDRLQYQVRPKFAKKVIPEVSSTIEIVTDDAGHIRSDGLDGASNYRARILDAACNGEVHNLGVQGKPEFSLPADVYYQPLCLETTYFDSKNKVLQVKLQPFSFVGPDPLKITLTRDKEIINFPDVPNALSYSYTVINKDGLPLGGASNLGSSLIDFKGILAVGSYRMILLAQGERGENVKAISYYIDVLEGDISVSVDLNFRFEREFYQTRSIKRLLLDQNMFDQTLGIAIADENIDVVRLSFYSGGFGAFIDSNDAFMRSSITYGTNTLSVKPVGLSHTATSLSMTVKDFTIFDVLAVSYQDGSLAKSGLEAWSSSIEQLSVQSEGNTLTTGMGLMILQ